MAVALPPFPKFVAYGNNGQPLSGGKLYSYIATTTTPLATYTDATGGTANPNPVVLDSAGRADVWLTTGHAYRLVLRDATDATTFWTVDNITIAPTGSPTTMDDYSATIAQMRLTTDPGEVGTESLATSAAGDTERERFAIKEMKGTDQWYETYTTRAMPVYTTAQSVENVVWTPTGQTAWNVRFRIPKGWQASSTLTIYFLYRAQTSGGAMKMFWTWSRLRDGAAPAAPPSPADISFAVADTNCHLGTLTISATNFLADDFGVVVLQRNGDDATDTNTGALFLDGAVIEYIGIASR